MLKTAKPAEKRRLANSVVTRDSTGSWSINVQSAVLKEWQEKYVDVRKDKGLVSKPPGLAATMWGGWAGLEDAKKRGEVWVVTYSGKDYYQWREFTETEREGHRGGVATEGRRKLDKASYQKINRALEEISWDLKLSPKELGDWEKNENAEVSQKVHDNLGKVQKACDVAYREAREIYSSRSRLPRHDVLAVPIAEKLKGDFEATPT